MSILRIGISSCDCSLDSHEPRLVVITGGPGAGKTAFLETAARAFCSHVAILPEAAAMVLDGSFPLHPSAPGRIAAQRAVYLIQREVERLVLEERHVAVALCDRGTVDGAAYWPNGQSEYWRELDSSVEAELGRYQTVIHFEAPEPTMGPPPSPLRTFSADEAHRRDQRIAELWAGHPRRITISSKSDFLSKLTAAVEVVRAELPPCCQDRLASEERAVPDSEGCCR